MLKEFADKMGGGIGRDKVFLQHHSEPEELIFLNRWPIRNDIKHDLGDQFFVGNISAEAKYIFCKMRKLPHDGREVIFDIFGMSPHDRQDQFSIVFLKVAGFQQFDNVCEFFIAKIERKIAIDMSLILVNFVFFWHTIFVIVWTSRDDFPSAFEQFPLQIINVGLCLFGSGFNRGGLARVYGQSLLSQQPLYFGEICHQLVFIIGEHVKVIHKSQNNFGLDGMRVVNEA